MRFAPALPCPAPPPTRAAPSRHTDQGAEALEEAAFLSGMALARLQGALSREGLPHPLLRARLALSAAEACAEFSGRAERAAELRDALHLRGPGDRPGPAGALALAWQRAVERPLSLRGLRSALPAGAPVAAWRRAARGTPVARAARVLEAALAEDPRAETAALILADAALSRALGLDRLVPLLATGLGRGDLHRRGAELRLACHRAATRSAAEAARQAAGLARGAERLTALAPRLRARGAGRAVEMILSRDAVAPAALAAVMSDRAARRFCARLVELDAMRELTGRDSFRLYGL